MVLLLSTWKVKLVSFDLCDQIDNTKVFMYLILIPFSMYHDQVDIPYVLSLNPIPDKSGLIGNRCYSYCGLFD